MGERVGEREASCNTSAEARDYVPTGLTLPGELCSFLGWTKPTLRGLQKTLDRSTDRRRQKPERRDW